MTRRNQLLPKIIIAVLVSFTILGGVMIYLHPVAIFPDPSWGFRVMQNMQRGGAFNILAEPSQQNIAEDHTHFVSWWSPGQYLLPYFFTNFLHINIGQGCALIIAICSVIGLLGYYRFFRQAGFSKTISALSIAFISSQVFYFTPFVFYNGGEVLLFAFGGWFLYGCFKFKDPKSWQLVLFILLSGCIGFFCKSSFLWIYLAAMLFIWIKTSRGQQAIKRLVNGLYIGIPTLAALAAIYFGYLAKGLTPAGDVHKSALLWETFGFPLASPILSGFSIDEISHGLLYHTDVPLFNYTQSIILTLVIALASILLVRYILKRAGNRDYKLMLIVLYSVCVVFFGVSFFKHAAISYEARHFRVLGLVLIPGVIYCISTLTKSFWVAFGFLWAFILCYSLQFVADGYKRNVEEQSHGVSGISQQFLDQDALDEVMKLDRASRNAIFVFISPDLGLEVQHNRIIILPPISQDMRIDYDEYQHCGHAGPLYIFLPAAYKGAKATMILKSFEDYKGFHFTQLSEDYVLYAAK